MISCIEMLLEHNYSARVSLLESVRKLSHDDFTRNLGVGEVSIRSLLVHLMNSEIYWINVIGNEETSPLELQDFKTVDDVAKRWKLIEKEMRDIIDGQTDVTLQYVKRLKVKGDTISFTIARGLLHLVTHEAHHRGFIVGLLRQMGYNPPNVNMLKELTTGDGIL
ncbi:MAG: DinB family protein [Candidatus Thorarchaeota archaeon]